MSHEGEELVLVEAQITPEQFNAIDEIVRRTGRDRSRVIRLLLDLGLAAERTSDDQDTKDDS